MNRLAVAALLSLMSPSFGEQMVRKRQSLVQANMDKATWGHELSNSNAEVMHRALYEETMSMEIALDQNVYIAPPSKVKVQKPRAGPNPCAGKKVNFPNVECVIDGMENVGPQSGANVTKGYVGGMEVDYDPITTPYWQNGLCPVNVHWHSGAEHLSAGEYDETATGPGGISPDDEGQGFLCNRYDETDPKFTTPYEWKYCKDMEVGQTYEVHWPHSAAGACGTVNQYQTPFYDGVFCTDGVLDLSILPQQVGVQAQIFIVVNDEDYYYPDLLRGMIIDGEYGADIAKYTGSTTGTTRSNEICSQYTPITWQVDRKCQLLSASAFDNLCKDMMAQRDDMVDDVHPHGARVLVADYLAANNLHKRE